MNKTALETDWTQPRMVSAKELRDKLLPLVGDWKWGRDAIIDLWKKGAPDPQHSVCPSVPKCKELECPHVTRVFLPGLFAQWWSDVANRQGLEMNIIKSKFDQRL